MQSYHSMTSTDYGDIVAYESVTSFYQFWCGRLFFLHVLLLMLLHCAKLLREKGRRFFVASWKLLDTHDDVGGDCYWKFGDAFQLFCYLRKVGSDYTSLQ